ETEASGNPEEQPANVKPVEPPETVEEQTDDTVSESTRAIDDDFTDRARQLKAGTWVEFRDADGQRIRAKLSWVSPITGTCLFTDRKGLKAGNYTIEELAHLLRSARARLLNAAPLMDRAVRIALKEYEKK
ncbi:hypothetical protein MNBD_GAMMA14-161, partial [hydrothermal vent metagenome]